MYNIWKIICFLKCHLNIFSCNLILWSSTNLVFFLFLILCYFFLFFIILVECWIFPVLFLRVTSFFPKYFYFLCSPKFIASVKRRIFSLFKEVGINWLTAIFCFGLCYFKIIILIIQQNEFLLKFEFKIFQQKYE